MWWVIVLIILGLVGVLIYYAPDIGRKVLWWRLKQRGFDFSQILTSVTTVDNTELLERMASRLELVLRRLERLENSLNDVYEQIKQESDDEEETEDIMVSSGNKDIVVRDNGGPVVGEDRTEKVLVHLRQLAHGVINDIREKREIRPNHWDLTSLGEIEDREKLLFRLTQIDGTIDVTTDEILEDPYFFSYLEDGMSMFSTEISNAGKAILESSYKPGNFRENMTDGLKTYIEEADIDKVDKERIKGIAETMSCLLPEKKAKGGDERMISLMSGFVADPVGVMIASGTFVSYYKYLSQQEKISDLLRSPEMIARLRGDIKIHHLPLHIDAGADQELVESLIAGNPMDFDRPEIQSYVHILDKIVRENPTNIRSFLDVAYCFYYMGYGRTQCLVKDGELNEENFEKAIRTKLLRGSPARMLSSIMSMLQN